MQNKINNTRMPISFVKKYLQKYKKETGKTNKKEHTIKAEKVRPSHILSHTKFLGPDAP